MKVLFFTAGSIPTQGELDAIAALQDSVVSLEVGVRSGVTPDGGSLETAAMLPVLSPLLTTPCLPGLECLLCLRAMQ